MVVGEVRGCLICPCDGRLRGEVIHGGRVYPPTIGEHGRESERKQTDKRPSPKCAKIKKKSVCAATDCVQKCEGRVL